MSTAGADCVMRPTSAGLGNAANGFEPHTAGCFKRDAAASHAHGFAHLVVGHIVEQDAIGARIECFLHLFERIAFDFDLRERWTVLLRAFNRCSSRTPRYGCP